MALFNKATKQKLQTINRANGTAYKQSAKMQLISMLLTSFAQDQFYRSAKDTFKDLAKLVKEVDAEFAAKAAIYARTKFGMRSITHVLGAELAAYASGKPWAKHFYEKMIFRPDDMLETVAYYKAIGGSTVPNAMKKGFAQAFNKFDGYQLAKYRGEGRSVKLVDIVNLVHPVATERNAKALAQLVAGTLKSTGTWESKLTQAGQTATNAKDKEIRKAAVWKELIESGKIGYFAVLRNLRNIAEQAPKQLDAALAILTNEHRIQKSLVLPFRYLVAYKQFNGKNAQERKIRAALDRAIEIACQNVPALEDTLVVVDNSGSMESPVSKSQHMRCSELGAVFGMMLAKRSNADLMEFGTSARYISYDLKNSVMTFGANFARQNKVGHGTSFNAIFNTAKKAYRRIVIFSDMQAWVGGGAPTKAFADYKQRTGADPFVYSIDLRGYGSLQFPENNVFELAGFSEKIFDTMKVLETDRNALVKEVEAIVL